MSTLDAQVAAHLLELRAVPELSADLRALTVSAVKQLDIGHGRKALLVFVPPPQLKLARKLHARIVRELEKKFSSQHVLIVAQRRILRTPARNARIGQMRPRSRTLTAVHENMLQDMVFPAEIVGKRTKVRVDGSKIVKIFLDRKDLASLEYKLDTFSACYKKVTGKEVVFEFAMASSNE